MRVKMHKFLYNICVLFRLSFLWGEKIEIMSNIVQGTNNIGTSNSCEKQV